MVINDNLSNFLNFSRWFSALLVASGHLRHLMFVNFNAVEHKNVIIKTFYFLTKFGHEAVIVFFILSGFLVGGKVIEKIIYTHTFSWKHYLINRMSRLYPVFIVALIIGYFLDFVGAKFFDSYGIYDNSHGQQISVINRTFIDDLSFLIFLSNLFMTQTILSPTLGSNGALWSLANEFWYYLMGPMLLLIFFTKSIINKIIYLTVIIFLWFFLPINITLYFLIWIVGSLLVFIKRPVFNNLYIPFFLLLASLTFVRLNSFSGYLLYDLVVALSFLLFAVEYLDKNVNCRYKTIHKNMADFSYSLYVLHFPMMIFLLSLLYSYTHIGIQMQPNTYNITLYFVILSFIYFYSFSIAMITEKKTSLIRKFILKILEPDEVIKKTK